MSKEQFDPNNPNYKKVEDLPSENQKNFTNIEGGFVQKSALEETRKKPIYGLEKSYAWSLQEDALALTNFVENKNFFINEAPRLIRENDFYKGVIPVAEKFGLGTVLKRHKELDATEIFIEEVLKITNEFDKDYKSLLDALADSVINNESVGYQSWSHSLCHPLETYKHGLSFLDTSESREVLTKLIDENVKRQKKCPLTLGCSDRILGPIVTYNLVEASVNNLERPYAYKPESLKNKEYIQLMKDGMGDKYGGFKIKAFLESNSPLEYYRLILEKGHELPDFLKPAQQIELLQNLEKSLSHDFVNRYVEKTYKPNGKDITYDELISNSQESKKAQEIARGVYVDVEGTLIKKSRDGQVLNEGLVKNIEKFATDGREIIIFTGGDISTIETALKKLGFPEKFLPVRSKNDYRGKLLETLVDDTPAEYQGFGALKTTDIFGNDG